jgi:hypothetical protein
LDDDEARGCLRGLGRSRVPRRAYGVGVILERHGWLILEFLAFVFCRTAAAADDSGAADAPYPSRFPAASLTDALALGRLRATFR